MDVRISNKVDDLDVAIACVLAGQFLKGLEYDFIECAMSEFSMKDGRTLLATGHVNQKSISVVLEEKKDGDNVSGSEAEEIK